MSTTPIQAYVESTLVDAGSADKISYSHLADSAETNESYFLHMPGTLTGSKYAKAAGKKSRSKGSREPVRGASPKCKPKQ